MKLIGNLKESVEKAETAKERKELIAQAGIELTDDEMEQISAGLAHLPNTQNPVSSSFR